MTARAKEVVKKIWVVGGGHLTKAGDCLCYLIDVGDLVLLDCGLGPDWDALKDNIASTGHDPTKIHTLLLTHGHIDHVGAAAAVRRDSGCRVVMHQADAWILERGDERASAASWYGMHLPPCPVDEKIEGERRTLAFSQGNLEVIHTPGHTPGSVSVLQATAGRKVLFGQDIHGPFHRDFGSDLAAWRESMMKLLAIEPDVLCEGHFGQFLPADTASAFIRQQLDEQETR